MEKVKGFTKFSGVLSQIRKLVDEAYELSEARRFEERALADDPWIYPKRAGLLSVMQPKRLWGKRKRL